MIRPLLVCAIVLASVPPALAQPALFMIEYALARLWMSWGAAPQAMIGHSVGEYVAACLAGVKHTRTKATGCLLRGGHQPVGRAAVRPDDTVLIYGAGPIGQAILLAAADPSSADNLNVLDPVAAPATSIRDLFFLVTAICAVISG